MIFNLRKEDEYIKLGQLLKACSLVSSGSEAKIIIKDGSVKVNGTITNPIIMTDTPIELKVNKYGANNARLSGAEFTLYKEDGTTVETTFTSANEEWVYSPIAPGTYVLKETKTVDGYTYQPDVTIVIANDGTTKVNNTTVSSVNITNTQTVVKIKKTDLQNRLLAGATLQIVDSENTVVVPSWTSTTEVKEIVGVLKVGTTYTLKEVTPPTDYATAPDVSFIIENDGTVKVGGEEVEFVQMIDSKLYDLTVSKKVEGNLGSRDQEFNFKVHFEANGSAALPTSVSGVKTLADGTTSTKTYTLNSTGDVTFTLTHGDKIVFKDLIEELKYTVTELDGETLGYKVTKESDTGVMTEDRQAKFTNAKWISVPTSADTARKLYSVLALLSALLLFCFVILTFKKRKYFKN